MASRFRFYDRITQCTGKHRFVMRSDAEQAARKGTKLHVYHCHWCGAFHVGNPGKTMRKPAPPPPEIDLSEVYE